MISWDPATKLIVSDNDWRYAIQTAEIPGLNAEIRRTNSNGKTELWHLDAEKGTEIEEYEDGTSRITTKFVSGSLAGKTRKIVENGPKGSETQSRIYDEKGRLMRMTIIAGNERREFDFFDGLEDSYNLKITNAKDETFQYEYRLGKLLKRIMPNDVAQHFQYDGGGKLLSSNYEYIPKVNFSEKPNTTATTDTQ